jgi:hypothetical protein
VHAPYHILKAQVRQLQVLFGGRKAGGHLEEIAAPEVGSSMKTMEGLATSSTAIVRRLRCSTLKPYMPDEQYKADSGDVETAYA